MRLKIEGSQQILADDVKLAQTSWARIVGLLGTSNLSKGKALWLIPCNSIHMLGMKYAIDAIYLSRQNEVLKRVAHLKPNRFGPIIWKAHSVLELPAGTLSGFQIKEGDTLLVEEDSITI